MTYHVSLSGRAIKDMRRLDKLSVNRVMTAINAFAKTGHGDVKKLTDADEEYRLRVGDWRVRFTLDDGVKILI